MYKTFNYRIYPTEDQIQSLENHFSCCRLVWNLALSAKEQAWESNRIKVSRYDLQKQLVELKKEYRWLYNINAQSLTTVLLNLDIAYRNFFKGYGFPNYKSKRSKQSFQCPQGVSFRGELLKLPKISAIKVAFSRPFEGKMKTVTIFKAKSGKYFASILSETGGVAPEPKPVSTETTLGIDLGVKSFVIDSNGKNFAPNRKLKDSLRRLQCLQRRASRKKKGSKNSKKAFKRVAIIHERIANQRADYIHKITTGLVRDSQSETFVIEDLNVKGMVKNRKLAQTISDVSFGEFRRQIEYKCKWYGKNLIVINRFEPTSKACSDCGHINQELTLADREWDCPCGSHHDRDHNAAKNIKNAGLKLYSRRGTPGEPVESPSIEGAMKQEFRMSQQELNIFYKTKPPQP